VTLLVLVLIPQRVGRLFGLGLKEFGTSTIHVLIPQRVGRLFGRQERLLFKLMRKIVLIPQRVGRLFGQEG